jgi:hypothetical protein
MEKHGGTVASAAGRVVVDGVRVRRIAHVAPRSSQAPPMGRRGGSGSTPTRLVSRARGLRRDGVEAVPPSKCSVGYPLGRYALTRPACVLGIGGEGDITRTSHSSRVSWPCGGPSGLAGACGLVSWDEMRGPAGSPVGRQPPMRRTRARPRIFAGLPHRIPVLLGAEPRQFAAANWINAGHHDTESCIRMRMSVFTPRTHQAHCAFSVLGFGDVTAPFAYASIGRRRR